MYGLSLGVQQMNEKLPAPVYALLSGLNASTVGIVALGAMQLAEMAIKGHITRILVIFGACAGVCYNSLWYFPVLMVTGGITTLVWEGHFKPHIVKFRARRRRESSPEGFVEDRAEHTVAPLEESIPLPNLVQRRTNASSSIQSAEARNNSSSDNPSPELPEVAANKDHTIHIRVGIPIIIFFFGDYFP